MSALSPRARVTTLCMNPSWSVQERYLWDRMHDPSKGKRKLTLHSLSKNDKKKRKKILLAIEKRKADDFIAGWSAYGDWIRH